MTCASIAVDRLPLPCDISLRSAQGVVLTPWADLRFEDAPGVNLPRIAAHEFAWCGDDGAVGRWAAQVVALEWEFRFPGLTDHDDAAPLRMPYDSMARPSLGVERADDHGVGCSIRRDAQAA